MEQMKVRVIGKPVAIYHIPIVTQKKLQWVRIGNPIGLAIPLWVSPPALVLRPIPAPPPPHRTYPWAGMQYILGVLNYPFSSLVRARHRPQSGVSVLSFDFLTLKSVGLNSGDREFLWL